MVEPFCVVPHQQSARALDDDQVAVGGELAHPARAVVQVEVRPPTAARGGGGGERVGESGVLVEVSHTSQASYVVEVARLVLADAGLRRLHDRDA